MAWPAGWPQILAVLACCAAAAALPWRVFGAGVPVAMAALVACFPLVVVERHLAAARLETFSEAETLARLLRVPLASILMLAIGALLAQAGLSAGR